MLKIGSVGRAEALDFDGFLRALLCCLDALPPAYRYAVENGTSRFILPEYLACLRQRNIIHVPAPAPLLRCRPVPGALAVDPCVLRSACLAMEEEGEEWAAFRETVRLCLGEEKTLYAYFTDGQGDGVPRGARAGAGVRRLTRLLAGLDCRACPPLTHQTESRVTIMNTDPPVPYTQMMQQFKSAAAGKAVLPSRHREASSASPLRRRRMCFWGGGR
jgi:hypothetical protein